VNPIAALLRSRELARATRAVILAADQTVHARYNGQPMDLDRLEKAMREWWDAGGSWKRLGAVPTIPLPKSLAVVWAGADQETRAAIERAHHEARRATTRGAADAAESAS
jgi:hypothetical protein